MVFPLGSISVNPLLLPRLHFSGNIYVTVSEKRAHFGQYFKIKLLVLNGRVALKQ